MCDCRFPSLPCANAHDFVAHVNAIYSPWLQEQIEKVSIVSIGRSYSGDLLKASLSILQLHGVKLRGW
jgi:hypothetical protein